MAITHVRIWPFMCSFGRLGAFQMIIRMMMVLLGIFIAQSSYASFPQQGGCMAGSCDTANQADAQALCQSQYNYYQSRGWATSTCALDTSVSCVGFGVVGNSYWRSCFPVPQFCPANSTASGGVCNCNYNYVQNSTNNGCNPVTTCAATGSPGATYQLVPLGTDKAAAMAYYQSDESLMCKDSCSLVGQGTATFYSYLSLGITNYAVGYSSSISLGTVCTASTKASTSGKQPANSCAPGQTMAEVSGRILCYNSDGTKGTSGPATSCGDISDSISATNADSSTTITTTITDTCTGKKSVSTQTYAPGVTPPPVAASGTGPAGSGAGAPGGSSVSPSSNDAASGAVSIDPVTGMPTGSQGDFCAKNPTADACKSTTSGSAATVDGLYSGDTSGKSFSGSLNNFKSSLQSAPFYAGASNFFTIGVFTNASCSGLSTTISLVGFSPWNIDFSPFLCGPDAESWYRLFSVGILLAATIWGFRIALL